MEEMSHVFLFAFFFTAANFHLGGRLHFSFSHCPNKIFIFFFQQNWLPSGLSLALALALLSTSWQTLKFSRKKDSEGWWGTRIRCCFLLFLKVRVAMQFTTETLEYLTCEILPLSYMKGWTYVRTIFSEIKFLGCIDNKIFLPKVPRFAHLKRESAADNNNIN